MEEELYLDIRLIYDIVRGFPGGTSGKKLACLCRRHKRHGLVPWVRKIPWRRAWQPTPVFLPGKLPCTKESSRLYSIGSQRVRHNWSHLPGTHTWHSYMRQVKSWRGWAGSPSAHTRKWLSSVQFSHSVVSSYLWSHGLQHARPPCPSLTPGACSNSCPLSPWCHSTISSSVIPFSHIRVFSNESVLHIRWPKDWSFTFSISPSNEYSGLISIRRDWLDLLAVQESLKSLLQCHSSKVSVLWCSAFFISTTLTSIHDHWKKP